MPHNTTQPTRILLSRRMADYCHDGIVSAMQGSRFELVHVDESQADVIPQVDLAFFSRDIFGMSSRNVLDPGTAKFFRVLSGQTALQWLQVFSAGVDRPVYKNLQERGVRISTASGATSQTVAHTALAGVLALARRLPDWMDAQRRRAWEPMRGELAPPDLQGQTALIVGLGRIGKEIARLLHVLGLHVIAVQRHPVPNPHCASVHPTSDLATLLPRADWVILSCPLTEQTRGLLDANAFAAIKQGAYFINIARGEVADEAALIDALSSGRLAGAYLDVFANEPLAPDSPLWSLRNVLISPHTAAESQGYDTRVAALFLQNLARWRSGEPLLNEMQGS